MAKSYILWTWNKRIQCPLFVLHGNAAVFLWTTSCMHIITENESCTRTINLMSGFGKLTSGHFGNLWWMFLVFKSYNLKAIHKYRSWPFLYSESITLCLYLPIYILSKFIIGFFSNQWSGCLFIELPKWLASSAGGPGFNPQSRTASYKDVIKMVPVVPLFSTQHWKGKYWLFLKN